MNKKDELIKRAIELDACFEGIKYAKQFKNLKEFLNSERRDFVDWFFSNINDRDNTYYLIDDDNFAIALASKNGHLEVVKLLLQDPRVDPSALDNYAIRWASEYGHVEVVKILLQDPRVDPSTKDNYAIKWASANGHLEVVKILLQDNRVDPSANNNYAIRWASKNGHHEVVDLLKNHKGVI